MINLESKCLRRVTIEIAIAAAKTSGEKAYDNVGFPASYDPIKAAESGDCFMAVCLAAARKCIEIVEDEL